MNNNQDNSDIFVVTFATILVCVVIFAMLKIFEPWVNAALGYMAWAHVLPFSQAARWIPALQDIPLIGGGFFGAADEVRSYLERGGFAYMGETSDRFTVLTVSGRCAMLFYAPLLVWAGWKGTNFRVDETHKRFHNLESLIRENAKKWSGMLLARQSNPRDMVDLTARQVADAAAKVLAAEPVKGAGPLVSGIACDIRANGQMRAATPEEWLVMKGICWDTKEYERIRSSMFAVKDKEWTMPEIWQRVDLESISEVLEAQLATRWGGIEKLPPALRALFAVLVLFYDGGETVKKANALLDDITVLAAWAIDRKLDLDAVMLAEDGFMANIDGIIAGKNGQRLNAICAKHAYVESALPTALRVSRVGQGVLAPASFLWMKRYNRLWWYILNNTGGEAMMIECAGAMAHNKSEIQIGLPLIRPCVWQASKAVHQDYLDLDPERIKARGEERVKRRKLSESLQVIWEQVEIAERRGAYEEAWPGK